MDQKKLRILLDCDGVLADFLTSVFDFVERETGERYKHEDVKTWEVFDSIAPQLKKPFDAEAARPGFCRSIKPYPQAKEAVQSLRHFGEIFIVTSPMDVPNWEKERRDWLKEHMDIDKYHVVSCPTKNVVAGDVLVDDKPENLPVWEQEHKGKALLWDAPYNRNTNLYQRVTDWEQVIQIVARLWREKNLK